MPAKGLKKMIKKFEDTSSFGVKSAEKENQLLRHQCSAGKIIIKPIEKFTKVKK